MNPQYTMNTFPESPEAATIQVLELFSQSRPNDAWASLNAAVEKFPADARLRFLLGSVLAGEQHYEKALSQLEFAVQLDPGFEIARFQLGSLRFTSGDAEGARHAWAPLAELPDGHQLRCFKNGCEALMEDRFADTANWLTQGIAANAENAHLNHDMQLLLDRTLQQMQVEQTSEPSQGPTHLLMSGYQTMSAEPQDFEKSADPTHQVKH